MDDKTCIAFGRLKAPFESSSVLPRNPNELEQAKSAVTSLKGRWGLEEANRELAILDGHIQDMLEGKNSYDQAENSFLRFCGLIGGCQLPRNTFG